MTSSLKSLLAWWSASPLLLLLPGLSLAQNSTVWKTNYYAVTGTTLGEIHESFRQARPWKEKSTYDGFTEWRINWRYQVTPSDEGCRCHSFTTQTAITVTLPRWTAPTNAVPGVREAWTKFFAALSKHEFVHGQNAQAAAAEMHQRVNRLTTESDCAAVRSKVEETAQRVVAEFHQRDADFDRQTAHGTRDGASLPRRLQEEFPRRGPGGNPRR